MARNRCVGRAWVSKRPLRRSHHHLLTELVWERKALLERPDEKRWRKMEVVARGGTHSTGTRIVEVLANPPPAAHVVICRPANRHGDCGSSGSERAWEGVGG